MKKIIPVIVLLALSPLLPAQPRITFEQAVLNLGVVDEGERVRLVFPFENSGSEILIIKRIDTSCGCIRNMTDQREYQPGEKGKLELIYNSQGRLGRITEQVVVFANTEEKFYRLQIEGTVIRKNYAQARIPAGMGRVDFGPVLLGQRATREVTLENIGSRGLRIIEVTVNPQVTCEFSRIRLDPNQSAAITITLVPLEKGELDTFVEIRTSALKGKNITIHILAEIVEELTELSESKDE